MSLVQILCLIVVALTFFVLFGGLYLLRGFKFKD
jgi:hypothetical protein